MSEPPRVHLDVISRQVVVGTWTTTLREREAAALQYLLERPNRLVLREELEREVWGFAPGVSSEVVPVTIRNVRKKLGPVGAEYLVTERGKGWILREPVRAAGVPRFGTPYQPRPELLQRVDEALRASRVVTLHGPGGMGKTRLAAELAVRWRGEVVWVALGAVDDADGVLRALLSALQAEVTDRDGLENALAARDGTLVVLDEAEGVAAAVMELLDTLPVGRFLVTSRRRLDCRGEDPVAVPPLTPDEARRFLTDRLAAARWGREASPATIERTIRLLDGLPLALELVAAHPDDLAHVVVDLEHGELPVGPEMDRLEAAVQKSWEPLDAAARQLLQALSACEANLTTAEIVDWRGAGAAEALDRLHGRALVGQDGEGWTVLRATRLFALARCADPRALRRELDAWLLRWFDRIWDRFVHAPVEAGAMLGRLREELLGALRRVDVGELPRVARGLYWALGACGPVAAVDALGRIVLARAPYDPEIRLLVGMMQRKLVEEADLDRGDAHPDPWVRATAATARRWLAYWSVDLDAMDTAASECPERWLAARIAVDACDAAMIMDEPGFVARAEACERLTRDLPGLWPAALLMLAKARTGEDRLDEAVALARRAIEAVPETLESQRLVLRSVAAGVLWACGRGEEALRESDAVVQGWERAGSLDRANAAASYAGAWLYALGDLEGARERLERGARCLRVDQWAPSAWTLALLRVRLGEVPPEGVDAAREVVRSTPFAAWFDTDGVWVVFDAEEALARGRPDPALRERLEPLTRNSRRLVRVLADNLLDRLSGDVV